MNRREHARAFVHQPLPKGKAWASLPYSYDFWRDDMHFLHCYEDNPKKGIKTRLEEACAAYKSRFGKTPNLILVSERDAGFIFPGCEVRVDKRIGPNNYQVGRQDNA